MSGILKTLGLVCGCAACFIVCDIISALWAKTNNIKYLLAVILLAPFGYIFFGFLNSRYQLSEVGGWVNIAIAVGTVSIGIVFFGDELTARKMAGLVLAFIAVVLLMG
jgi:multidrug transporter EmrE-like cation transporter